MGRVSQSACSSLPRELPVVAGAVAVPPPRTWREARHRVPGRHDAQENRFGLAGEHAARAGKRHPPRGGEPFPAAAGRVPTASLHARKRAHSNVGEAPFITRLHSWVVRAVGGDRSMGFCSTMPDRRVATLPIVALLLAFQSASGQIPEIPGGSGEDAAVAAEAPVMPEPLTRQTVRDVVSVLNDAQVREFLLRELDRRVAEREAELAGAEDRALGTVLRDWATSLGTGWLSALQATPRIPAAAAATVERFQAARGDAGPWRLAGTTALCLLAGLAAALGARRLTRGPEARLDQLPAAGLWAQIGIITGRFVLQGVWLIAFVAVAHVADVIVNRAVPADSSAVRYLIRAIGWTWFAVMAARFVLSPMRPKLRLCTADDRTAWFLTWRVGLIFGVSAFALSLLRWAREFEWPYAMEGLRFWVSVIFHGLMALTIWQARGGITRMVLGHADHGPAWRRFAALWPAIAIGLVVFQYLLVELFVATGNREQLSITALNVSVAVVLALPLIELALRALVEAIWPGDPELEEALRVAHRETQLGLVRCGRIVAAAVLVVALVQLWGLDLHDLASQGIGAQLASVLVEILLIGVVAYGLWELLEVMANRQIAIERVTLGLGGEGEEQFEGEGGRGGTRLGTVLPLVRRTGQAIIAALALLAVLAQIGVNVTPLLAGAGILGLAIGFGAQALVKDVISGVFFLIDDAFRKGEYIDIGTVKGTVESISIRSMQLRHHNGPLNTIPFGEIRHLTNFSRDWVMMKLPLRVTYDTDVETLRKLIKKLGQDLLQDPELGPMFLQPLKSQGVIQMEDSAMIIRVKFMTRPGDQWTVRNKVFARLRELFEREGIRFAHREVTVRIADQEAGKPPSGAQREAAAAAARSVVEQREAGAGAAAPDDR